MRRLACLALLVLLTGCAPAVAPAPRPSATAAPRPVVNERDGSALMPVAGGTFIMGTDDPSVIFGKPSFRFTVEPFLIGKYEVTNRQYARFVKESGYKAEGLWRDYFTPGLEDHPVVCVSWKDAAAYCTWAGLRLPTEAEWEKAARGEQGQRHVWGDTWSPEACNNWNLRRPDRIARMAHFVRNRGTTPVGLFEESVSPAGCYDMAGNVWEWTSTVFRPYPYRADDGREDPTVAEPRVMRGGSWYSVEQRCLHCAERVGESPRGMFSHFVGFRVARSLRP